MTATTLTKSASKTSSKLSASAVRKIRLASMLDATISGIPCKIEVNDCIGVKGSYNRMCDSDWDYYGFSDISYTVYDRKGYKADWLSKKITDDEDSEIQAMIIESESDDGDY